MRWFHLLEPELPAIEALMTAQTLSRLQELIHHLRSFKSLHSRQCLPLGEGSCLQALLRDGEFELTSRRRSHFGAGTAPGSEREGPAATLDSRAHTSQIVVTFFCRPLPAVPFWFSPIQADKNGQDQREPLSGALDNTPDSCGGVHHAIA